MMLLVELHARRDCCEQLEMELARLAEVAASEAGVLVYAVNRVEQAPMHFVLYELYRSRADWETHLALPAVKQALARFPELLEVEPRLVFGAALQRVGQGT